MQKKSNVRLCTDRTERKKVEKYLSKELFQKTEESFQQTQTLQDLGNKRKQWQGA